MSQYDTTFDLKIIVGHCDLYFNSPLILPYILNSIWWMNVIVLENQFNMTFDLKINLGHSDLYLIVQWYLLIFFWETF